jgi:hypothetical protein
MTEFLEREPIPPEDIPTDTGLSVADLRRAAYQVEADPLFFKSQRADNPVTEQDWLDKIEEIRARFPYPPA